MHIFILLFSHQCILSGLKKKCANRPNFTPYFSPLAYFQRCIVTGRLTKRLKMNSLFAESVCCIATISFSSKLTTNHFYVQNYFSQRNSTKFVLLFILIFLFMRKVGMQTIFGSSEYDMAKKSQQNKNIEKQRLQRRQRSHS